MLVKPPELIAPATKSASVDAPVVVTLIVTSAAKASTATFVSWILNAYVPAESCVVIISLKILVDPVVLRL